MKQKLLALLCALALLTSAIPAALALPGEQTRAADTLYTLGIVNDGGELAAPATRAQTVALLVRLAGCQAEADKGNAGSGFRDLPAWAAKDINYANAAGWVSGVTATTFGTDRTVSADACCTFLLRMLGYSDAQGDFRYSEAAAFAQHIGLLSREYTGSLTRGDLFEIARDALTFYYQDGSETVIGRLISKGLVSSSTANALGLLDKALTARQIADRYTAAVFALDSYRGQIYIDVGEPSDNASGFFIDKSGVAVTNYHAIQYSIYSVVTLSTGEQYPVERVLWYDIAADLAILKISDTSLDGKQVSGFAALEPVPSDTLRVGDTVYTIGNPLGLGLAVSSGVISALSREVGSYSLPCIMNTADISQGSSGGALLNEYGQAVGVTSGAFAYGNNMYLAVPLDSILSADRSGAGWTLREVNELQRALDEAAK